MDALVANPITRRKELSKKSHQTLAQANIFESPFGANKKGQTTKESSFNFHSELPDSMKYRVLKTKQSRLKVMRSKIQGWGLFSTQEIEENEMIIEYMGEIIGQAVADKREKLYEQKGIGCYMFKIREDEIIDATKRGNKARFVNHSCEPNAATKIIFADGKHKIIIYAKQTIKVGEEIAYDYMFPIEEAKIPCNCGATKCRGTMN